MRVLGPVAALAFAVWLSAAPALAITFLLEGGETIEGAIIDATRNTVIIRPRLGGLRQVPVGQLEQLKVTTADGQRVRGRYHGWLDGRYGIEVGTELLWLKDDRVVARSSLAGPAVAEIPPPEPVATPRGPAAAPPVQPSAPRPQPSAAASAPAAVPPAQSSPPPAQPSAPPAQASAPRPQPSAAASAPAAAPPAQSSTALALPDMAPAARASELGAAAVMAPLPPVKPPPEPAAAPETVALPASDLPIVSVKAAPEEVSEKSGEIVFTVELSRPVDDLLVVIYSTVDGLARSGVDYAPLQGMLTLPPGVTSQQIRTAVIDDADREGDEDFQLFLATNPELTELAQQWTRVTIHDDD
jgi:hypothetical protein